MTSDDNPILKSISDYTLAILAETENRENFLIQSKKNKEKLLDAMNIIESLPEDEWHQWCEAPKAQILSILGCM